MSCIIFLSTSALLSKATASRTLCLSGLRSLKARLLSSCLTSIRELHHSRNGCLVIKTNVKHDIRSVAKSIRTPETSHPCAHRFRNMMGNKAWWTVHLKGVQLGRGELRIGQVKRVCVCAGAGAWFCHNRFGPLAFSLGDS